MKKLKLSRFVSGCLGLALMVGVLSLVIHNYDSHICEGIAPDNDLNIPVGSARSGVDEAEFNRVLDRIEDIYAPLVKEQGGNLVVKRLWGSGTVNASAQRKRGSRIINMYGGFARHRFTTSDGFALVACHEMGHHLGGAPRYSGWLYNILTKIKWASNEGQSDYYATSKCFRMYAAYDDNQALMEGVIVPPRVAVFCQMAHQGDQEQVAVCRRGALAGLSLGSVLGVLGKTGKVSFNTLSTKTVKKTSHTHPKAQCRLDTYFQGTLCHKGHGEEVSSSDPGEGYCSRNDGEHNGVRPTCWYRPRYTTF